MSPLIAQMNPTVRRNSIPRSDTIPEEPIMAAPADSWLGSQPHRASLQHNTLESDNLSHDDMMSQMGSLLKDLSRGEDGIRKFLAAGEGAEVPAGVPQIVKQSVPLEQLLGSLQDLLFVVEGAMPVQSPIPSHMSSPRSPGNPAVNSQTIRTPGYPSARNSYAPPATKPPPPPGVLFYDSIPERFSRFFRSFRSSFQKCVSKATSTSSWAGQCVATVVSSNFRSCRLIVYFPLTYVNSIDH